MAKPLSNRQRMINMMYLVLIALLALNVSSEVLNAFNLVNQGITESSMVLDEKNEFTYDLLDQMKADANSEEMDYISRADRVRAISTAMDLTLKTLIDEIVEESGGYNELGKLVKEDNLDIASNLMINQEKGKDLQLAVLKAREEFLSVVDEAERNTVLVPLKAEDPNEPGDNRDWATANFDMVPSIAAITMLNQMRSDVKSCEANVLNYLVNKATVSIVTPDHIEAHVSSNLSHVQAGEKYVATILPLASDTKVHPKVYIGSIDPDLSTPNAEGVYNSTEDFPLSSVFEEYDAPEGKLEYEIVASGAGPKSFEGAIEIFDPNGDVTYYPFKNTYNVVQSEAVVAATGMNVLWIGLDNPVSISVPGIVSENVNASITAGTLAKDENGNFIARVNSTADVHIDVEAVMGDGVVKSMGRSTFRVKKVPLPVLKVGNSYGGDVPTSFFNGLQGVLAELKGFEFHYQYVVHSFDLNRISSISGFESKHANSAEFTKEMRPLLNNLDHGDHVVIDNVKVQGLHGGEVRSIDGSISFRTYDPVKGNNF